MFCAKQNIFEKIVCLIFLGLIFFITSFCQCIPNEKFQKKLSHILTNPLTEVRKKLLQLYELKKEHDVCGLPKDSTYALLLSKIGYNEFYTNKNYSSSIALTLESIRINSLLQRGSSKIATITDFLNLAYYYLDKLQISKSLSSCDSVILLGEKFKYSVIEIAEAKALKAYLYYQAGDFQKCIEESTKGIQYTLKQKDTLHYVDFLVQRSQSYFSQNMFDQSFQDNQSIFKTVPLPYHLASAFKRNALIYAKNQNFEPAIIDFKKAIGLRIKTKQYKQVIADYIDLGNLYCFNMKNLSLAKLSFDQAIKYTFKENNLLLLAEIYNNIENIYFLENNFDEAINYNLKTFKMLKLSPNESILDNPTAASLNAIGGADLMTDLLNNKVKLLLALYRKTTYKKYITASIQTALVTDSVITLKRHQQLGEQSKLYWRDKTRDFFTTAIEACYSANDVQHAFYFMEKSRSVLLNDKLNELGASSKISETDAIKELDLKLNILQQQKKLNELTINTPAYNNQQQIFLNTKQNLEDFIKSLEVKYPAYYNYKYSDAVPALQTLQKHLAANNQSFVHYFTNDTLAYILSITANNAKLTKLLKKDFSYQQINDFLKCSSNRDLTNTKNGFKSFATLSNTLYKTLFQPLQLPKGRVIICSDNFLLPFESLCCDAEGASYLINDYIFSYAYSATNLLKQYNTYEAKGNFIGFAPVSFQAALHVNPLINSAAALNISADNYSSTILFTNTDATKNNFIKNIGSYTIVNVFSHASADSTETEPRLYMHDSTINLSELQLINKPAARLVVLSACQTNVGKNASGEGIYSLARGFTSAGIPSTAATLWNADEDMIYEISAKFHKYLSQGISKDIALHNAKLDFLKRHINTEKELPYFWANIILIGNTEPLVLTVDTGTWWWITVGIIIVIFALITLIKNINAGNSHPLHL